MLASTNNGERVTLATVESCSTGLVDGRGIQAGNRGGGASCACMAAFFISPHVLPGSTVRVKTTSARVAMADAEHAAIHEASPVGTLARRFAHLSTTNMPAGAARTVPSVSTVRTAKHPIPPMPAAQRRYQ